MSVVLHPLSTSNHNYGNIPLLLIRLYCILFLHQTTTLEPYLAEAERLYCILFLHQTTTLYSESLKATALYCILFLHQTTTPVSVISSLYLLYCILFLHQTTTTVAYPFHPSVLYCILFLHQTTTENASRLFMRRCIASSFYIKPQPRTPDTLIFGHLTASRHDTKRGGVHRGSRFDAVFTFSTNIRKIIFTEIRRCMSVQRAGARLRSDSSEANI